MFTLGDIARMSGCNSLLLSQHKQRGLIPAGPDDRPSSTPGCTSFYSELSARRIALAAVAAEAGIPPRQAHAAARCFVSDRAENQFHIDGAGNVTARHEVGQRAPGRPFVTGDSWFACRKDGAPALINTPKDLLNAGAVARCLEGEPSGFLLIDLCELDSHFNAMKRGLAA